MNPFGHFEYVVMQCSSLPMHGGFGGSISRGSNVVVFLDNVGESKCTRSLTLLIVDPRRKIEVTHR